MTGTSTSNYSPRYEAALKKLLKIEGGFVDDPVDRGGATKYGISLRFLVAEGAVDANGDGYKDFDLDMDGDIDGADIRRLTLDHARELYHRCFWLRCKVDRFPEPLGEMVFDQAVNGGAQAALKMLQIAVDARAKRISKSAKPLKIDGVIGPVTMAALDVVWKFERPLLIEAYREAVRARYRAIVAANPSQKRFLKGWLRRANELGR